VSDDGKSFRPISPRVQPRFAGVPTFLRLPQHDEPADVDALICGAPFDGGTTFRPGARFGPRAVRVASALTRGFHPDAGFDLFDRLRCADGGDVACVPMSMERTQGSLAARAKQIAAAGAVAAFVGGDHSISLGVLRGLAEVHGPLGLVHFDAHSDTYGPAWDVDLHHGTIFRLAADEGLLARGHVVQIGIRGPFTAVGDLDAARARGFRIVGIDECKRDLAGVEASLAAMSPAAAPQKLYVSFDLDAIDPAYAPGTGTPVPGGLTSYEALRLVRSLAGLPIVGCDVVEISPDHDPSGNTALLAAALLAELLVAVAAGRARS